MRNVFGTIEAMKKKLRKGQTITLVWDEYGSGYEDDIVSVTYRSHDKKRNIITAINANGDAFQIEGDDINGIKSCFLVKGNFAQKSREVTQYKKPLNAERHVGIELEFISSKNHEELKLAFVQADLEQYLTLKDDGSLDGDDDHEYTHELCILASETMFKKVVMKVCAILKGNSTVNKTCGMHVHLDMRTRNPDMAYASLFKAQPILYAMCPKSRRDNSYCQPEMRFNPLTGHTGGDRYFGINKTAYMAHKTIEIRVHSGTLVADKICNWVSLLIKIVDNTPMHTERDNPVMWKKVDQFKKDAKIRGNLAKYVEKRIEEFAKDHKTGQLALIA